MYKKYKISVVIPCYNEEKAIPLTIKSIPKWVDEIMVVDNNSFDKTAPIARKLGATVIREKKQGYGAACQKGIKSAKGNIIITSDADCTYPLQEIGRMIDYLLKNNLDFVAGNRFPLKYKSAMPWPNRLGNLILTLTMNSLTLKPVEDSQTGMWVFRRSILKKIHPFSNKMSFSEEIKMEALLHPKIKYGEYHINYRDRIGNSKLRRMRDGIPNLLFLFKKRWQILWRRS
ncbi:MAG TPA: glycosyltransferase family 2 protein [Patescibacteria group bacterium]|nr:glycosyltransferase family 2 protein [Patescibacteria group bacterium]